MIRPLLVKQPYVELTYAYQNINSNPRIKKEITDFFYNKVIKWINSDDDFKQYKHGKFVSSSSIDKEIYIYKLLKHLIKKTNLKWYELRDYNYKFVKKYFSKNLY
jgi:hypothetical protein